MVTIKDSVHDHIDIEGVAEALLETPPVQRLRRIRQLGTVQLVYPSANHTRFEHSLGVLHLADRALEHLSVAGQQAERVRAAALLHDIGHSPYSHNTEDVVQRYTGRAHDDVGPLITEGPVARVLTEYDLDPAEVAGLVRGEGELGQLVSGELDVDRMDYLVRDAHHTGVPYGTIDQARLVRELALVDGELALDEGNVQTAESLLLARALMNPTVYNHHAARVGKAMLRRGAERLLESGVAPEELRRMDDWAFHVALRNEESTAAIAHRLDRRDLFKRAVWAEIVDVPDDLLASDHYEIQSLEVDIADRAGVDPDAVVVDIPGEPRMKESTTKVVVNGEARRLDQQSALVDALRTAQREQWRMGVYCPDEHTETVGPAAESVLGLELDALVTDVRTRMHARLDDF
ncbi:HD domain-containing protein [Haloglomus halophilum]|uniref:HD domain-containing protein n=1 Tax=Haloglomus halophilum TaxID=2962672 RepID=UPI0020CA180F|nr:HD domain-containing protein [Haloglomus halophilum]